MSYDYVTIDDVTFIDLLPSGKAFSARYQDRGVVIPNFAVHDDSEIWKDSDCGDTGKLVIQEKIAVEKGLADPGTGSLGGGIPLKRNKRPDPLVLLPDQTIRAITDRLAATSGAIEGTGWDTAGEVLRIKHTDDDAAIFDGDRRFHDAQFCACAPDDIRALLKENQRLREWMALATKRFNARRKRR